MGIYSTYKEPHGNKRLLEGVWIALAIMGATFLLACACFASWSDWGPDGPTSPWTKIPMALISFYGATQWIVILPVYFFYQKRNFKFTAKGLLWTAGGITLLNALLFLVL